MKATASDYTNLIENGDKQIENLNNQIQEYLLSKKSLSIKEEDYVNLKRIDEQNGEYKKHGDEQ